MATETENRNTKLVRELISSHASIGKMARSIRDTIVNGKLKVIQIATLVDLYQVFLPVQSTINELFETTKKYIRDKRPNEFGAIQNCQPSADEYAAIANMLTGFIRKEIEARAVKETSPDAIHSRAVFAAIEKSLAANQPPATYPENAKFYEVKNDNEVFYAPFDKDKLVDRLTWLQRGKDAIATEFLSQAIKQARRSKVIAYGEERDYAHYNAFAAALAAQKDKHHKGFNQNYFDTVKLKTTWKEKQVDVLIAIRSMELLLERRQDYVSLVVSDTDFIPVFQRFKAAGQKYFLIYIKPINQSKNLKKDQNLAKLYQEHPDFDMTRVIEVDLPLLLAGFLENIGYYSEGVDDRLYEFQENIAIYKSIGEIMREEYEQELTDMAQQQFNLYCDWLDENSTERLD